VRLHFPYVNRKKYLPRIPTARRRSAGGDPEGSGDSFRTLGLPARAEGCPLFDRPKRGRKTPHQPARAQVPASPSAWPADHRSASGLTFLCSCFPEGLWWRPRIVGGDRPGKDVLPHTEDRSTDGDSQTPGVARPSLSLSTRERTFFRRVGETLALASLPRKRSGENKRGLLTRGGGL